MDVQKNFNRIRDIAIGAGIVVLAAYLLNFGGYGISKEPGDWGVFGDYVGGFLNPIIAFLNLLLTYYIAKMVNDFSKRENIKQALVQNRVIKSQLAFDALKDFQIEIELQFRKILDPTINTAMVIYNLQQAISAIESFHTKYNHLFTENPMFHSRLINDLRTAAMAIRDSETIRQNFSHQGSGASSESILEGISNSKDSLISNLNRELVRRLDANLIVP